MRVLRRMASVISIRDRSAPPGGVRMRVLRCMSSVISIYSAGSCLRSRHARGEGDEGDVEIGGDHLHVV